MAYQLHWIERFLLTGTDLQASLGEGEGNLRIAQEARHAKTFNHRNNFDHYHYWSLC
jgi:hypothetical protein